MGNTWNVIVNGATVATLQNMMQVDAIDYAETYLEDHNIQTPAKVVNLDTGDTFVIDTVYFSHNINAQVDIFYVFEQNKGCL